MPDIMVCLACLRQYLDCTTLGRLSRVTEAMLAMTGRVTNAGARAMGRHRGELSDDPTILYDQLINWPHSNGC